MKNMNAVRKRENREDMARFAETIFDLWLVLLPLPVEFAILILTNMFPLKKNERDSLCENEKIRRTYN